MDSRAYDLCTIYGKDRVAKWGRRLSLLDGGKCETKWVTNNSSSNFFFFLGNWIEFLELSFWCFNDDDGEYLKSIASHYCHSVSSDERRLWRDVRDWEAHTVGRPPPTSTTHYQEREHALKESALKPLIRSNFRKRALIHPPTHTLPSSESRHWKQWGSVICGVICMIKIQPYIIQCLRLFVGQQSGLFVCATR